MKHLTQTIETLRTTLQTRLLTAAAETAASHYATQCAEASRRLEAVAAMLAKGSDYQALQSAELDPPLLDLVGALSFGEEKAWQDFCVAQGLPVAPRLDSKTVLALDQLYAQGITANHPLYKDFRASVLARDEATALRILRTILKLNPADANAKSELVRLENKRFQDTLEQLRTALKTDNEEHIATLAETLPALAPADKLPRNEDYQKAESIRRALRRRQAEEKLPGLLETASTHQSTGDWSAAATLLDSARALIQTHDIELPPGTLKEQLESLTEFVRRRRATAEKQRDFDRALRSFTIFVNELETRMLTGSPLSYLEALQNDDSFVRRWRELEAFQLPVAQETLTRLRSVGQELRRRLEALQRTRRTRLITSTASMTAALLAVAGVAFHGWQALTYTQELSGYRARTTAAPAEELIRALRDQHPLLMRWPFLKAKVEETDVWTRQSREQVAQSEQAIAELETALTHKGDPALLLKQLENAKAGVAQVASDLATGPAQKLAALRTKIDLHLADVSKQGTTDVRKSLEDLVAQTEKELTFERRSDSAAASVRQIEQDLLRLEAALKPEVDALQLPADVEARIKTLRQKLTQYQSELDRFAQTRALSAEANTLAEYQKSLMEWQNIRFAEASVANTALANLPTEESFLAGLMTGGDVAAWKSVQADTGGYHMSPDQPLESDLKTLLSLRDDRFLNGIWEHNVTDFSKGRTQRTVWSRGPLKEANVGTLKRWSGLCFDPNPSDVSVVFTDYDYKRLTTDSGGYQGEGVTSSQVSGTSQFMGLIQLNRMTDAEGMRFQKPLMEMIESIVRDKNAHPIARAYVLQALEGLTRLRPHDWGLHLSFSLRSDLTELRRLIGNVRLGSEDWMVPKMRSSLTGPLTKFFSAREQRSYLAEARARRDLLREVNAAGLKFGGYVEVDLNLKLTQLARSVKELWVLSKDGIKPLRISNTQVGAPVAEEAARLTATGALPLSPVFIIPLDRAPLLERYQLAVSGQTKGTPLASPTETPFLEEAP